MPRSPESSSYPWLSAPLPSSRIGGGLQRQLTHFIVAGYNWTHNLSNYNPCHTFAPSGYNCEIKLRVLNNSFTSMTSQKEFALLWERWAGVHCCRGDSACRVHACEHTCEHAHVCACVRACLRVRMCSYAHMNVCTKQAF